MNNFKFDDTSFSDRETRLLNVLTKKTFGQLDKRVLLNIIRRLDLGKQIEVELIDKKDINRNLNFVSTVLKDGETLFESISRKSVCLLGNVIFGHDKVVKDELDYIYSSSNKESKVMQYPLIVETTEIEIDKKDNFRELTRSKLIICLNGF